MTKAINTLFNNGTNGWTLVGDVQSSGWQSTGGDPGGYLGWVDAATGADSYYQAGSSYLGDKSAFVGGTLSYDILDTGNDLTAYDVQIVGDGITLQYTSPNDSGFPTPNTWTKASVTLGAPRFIDTATGAAPSAVEFRSVLQDITQLEIRAEYVNGAESGGLDNVSLAPKATHTPAVPHVLHAVSSLAGSHHAGFGADLAHWIP